MEQGTESGSQPGDASPGLVGHPILVAKSASRRSHNQRRAQLRAGLVGEPAAPTVREPQSAFPVVLALVLLLLVLFGP